MFEKWIKQGIAKGLTDIEIFSTTAKSLQLTVYQGKTDQHVKSKVESIRVKGIYQGKAATVTLESLDDKTVDAMLDRLIESAKNITANEPALIFEGSKKYPVIDTKIFDFDSVPFEKKKQLLVDLESKVLANELCLQVQTSQYIEVAGKTTLVNSKGLNLSKEFSYAYAYAVGVFKKDNDVKAEYEISAVKDFSEFNVDKVAKKIIDKGVAAVGGKSVPSSLYKTVFSKETFADLMAVFSSIYSAEMAFRNMSPLKEKVGQKIAVREFSLIDDPLNKGAFQQNSFDDEGVACQTKPIIENGVFKGFLHNLKTAAIFNQDPTGNGFGGSISPSNMYVKPGVKSFDQIMTDVKDGIYITSLAGLHSGVKQVSGDFSLQAGGFKIENGKVTTAVKMIIVSGNLFTMLGNIKDIGADLEFGISGFGSPTVYVGDLSIAGEE